jgi:hypothetical protein
MKFIEKPMVETTGFMRSKRSHEKTSFSPLYGVERGRG